MITAKAQRTQRKTFFDRRSAAGLVSAEAGFHKIGFLIL
jgi:hypothetical protein